MSKVHPLWEVIAVLESMCMELHCSEKIVRIGQFGAEI